jgi:hypothetical protein
MLLSLLASLVALAAAQPQLAADINSVDEPMPGPILVWSDEFDGDALDQSKWSFDTCRNKAGWYNQEQQYYSAIREQNLRSTSSSMSDRGRT